MPSPSSRRVGKSLLVAVGLLPVAWLIVGFYRDDLGANPIEKITHVTGDWALRFLLASLAVTPLRRLTGWNGLIAYRRMLGLFAFFYAVLHLTTFTVLDHFFDWQEIVADVYKRLYVTAGMTAFVCLLPLALTSTRGWIRRLGGRWTRLHRLAYVAAVAAVLHYWWLVKADVRAPFWYAALLTALFAVRLVYRLTAPRAVASTRASAARAASGPVGETPAS